MFGLVCSGRPVEIAQEVSTLNYVFNIDNSSQISHVSLFVLPNTYFDPGYTALVYFRIPDSPTKDQFKLMGRLNADKPSAIFKIRDSRSSITTQMDDDMMVDEDEPKIYNVEEPLVIGISVEPNEQAMQQWQQERQEQQQEQLTVASSTETISAGDMASKDLQGTALLANKIVSNAYNYLGSFVDDNNKVSMTVLDGWWKRFREKLERDPSFLNN